MWQHSTFPDEFPGGALGGAESATWYIARQLSQKHEVEVITSGGEDSETEVDGINLVRVKSRLSSKWVRGDLYYKRAMEKAKESDIVEAITCIEPAFYSDRVAVHLENDLDPYLPFPRAKANLYIRRINRIRIVTGVSRYVSKRFSNRFPYRGKVATVLNGADCDEFNPKKRDREFLHERYGISDDDTVLTYAGAVHRRKGLHLLLDALEEINDPCIRLLILGGLIYSKKRPEDARYLSGQVERLKKIPQATFVGPLPKAEMARVLASSEIFVCPSIWQDPSPLVCAEAQASGLPVIGFDRGGVPELVEDSKTGLITEASGHGLAEAIQSLHRDRRFLEILGASARRRAEVSLSWRVLSHRIEELLIAAAEMKKSG